MSLLLRYDLPRAGRPTYTARIHTLSTLVFCKSKVKRYHGQYDLRVGVIRFRNYKHTPLLAPSKGKNEKMRTFPSDSLHRRWWCRRLGAFPTNQRRLIKLLQPITLQPSHPFISILSTLQKKNHSHRPTCSKHRRWNPRGARQPRALGGQCLLLQHIVEDARDPFEVLGNSELRN